MHAYVHVHVHCCVYIVAVALHGQCTYDLFEVIEELIYNAQTCCLAIPFLYIHVHTPVHVYMNKLLFLDAETVYMPF